MPNLTRFHIAQQNKYSGYDQALKEISAGQKTSHWIWYILPQLNLSTLGQSENSRFYGLVNFEEACDYLQDPVLFKHYNEMIIHIEKHLKTGVSLKVIMGSPTDAKKLISSLTLFRETASYLDMQEKEPKHDFKTLRNYCDTIFTLIANKYAPCPHTLSYLKSALAQQETIKPVTQIKTGSDNVSSQAKKSSNSSLFHSKPIPVERPETAKAHATLIPNLARYLKRREQEWSFHFNFLGIMAVVYFIQDFISGTDHFNSKSREIKISAATKLKNLMDPSVKEQSKPFTPSEKTALKEGRLGALVTKNGGLEQLIQNAPNKNKQDFTFKF